MVRAVNYVVKQELLSVQQRYKPAAGNRKQECDAPYEDAVTDVRLQIANLLSHRHGFP